MSGGRQTKVRQWGVLDNVLTFLWASQLCGFEGQWGVFMWNQVSTHYELGITSLHCQWPVNRTSRPVVTKQWCRVKKKVVPERKANAAGKPKCFSPAKRMNHKKWGIVRFHRLRDWGCITSVLGFFFLPLCLLCSLYNSTPITSPGSVSAPVTASQLLQRILIGQKWPICDLASSQTSASWRTGSYKGQIVMHLGKMCPLFLRRRRAVVKAEM